MNVLWNYLHFVVPIFIFCSGWVTHYQKSHNTNINQIFGWYRKRIFRLYLPYLGYLTVYYVLNGFPSTKNLLVSLTLVGGMDISWLTLLFLQLTLITPIMVYIRRNNQLSSIFLILLGLFALVMVFFPIPSGLSRAVAWIPWSGIYLLGMLYAKEEQHIPLRFFILITTASTIFFLILNGCLIYLQRPLTLTLHKYPPDLFYLSYGFTVNSVLLLIIKTIKSLPKILMFAITFLSRYSYGLFFIHLLTLTILNKITGAKFAIIPVICISIVSSITFLYIFDLLFTIMKRNTR